MPDANPAAPPKAAAPEVDPMEELQRRLAPQLEQAAAQLTDVNEKVKTFIRQNPGTTLLGAAALGFIIGRLASRR